MTNEWDLLRQLPRTVPNAGDLPSGLYPAIASRLEEAIAEGSREGLMAIQEELASFFKTYLRQSSREVVDAVRGAPYSEPNAAAAYALGQISFAQLLAGQIGNRRVDETFAIAIQENIALLRPLLERDRTGLELAEATGLRPETISRKLKTLREAGVIDYHRDGTSLYNFLTPAAKTIASSVEDAVTQDRRSGSVVRRAVSSRQSRLSPHMRCAMTFASPAGRDVAFGDKIGARR